jgi:hypothetical protein
MIDHSAPYITFLRALFPSTSKNAAKFAPDDRIIMHSDRQQHPNNSICQQRDTKQSTNIHFPGMSLLL